MGSFLSPQQQVAIGGLGALGGLGLMTRGASDVTSSELETQHQAVEDASPQRWTSTSAELWPVRFSFHPSLPSSTPMLHPRLLTNGFSIEAAAKSNPRNLAGRNSCKMSAVVVV